MVLKLSLFIVALCATVARCQAQAGGPGYTDLPFLQNRCSGLGDLSTNLGAILYVNVLKGGVTNISGVSPAGNADAVMGWKDLTPNLFSLMKLDGVGQFPTNFLTGGANNLPYIDFNGSWLTNTCGATNISQPCTFYFVMLCQTPITVGYILNGQPGQVPQWNEATGAGGTDHLYAGTDVGFVAAANEVALGWPAGQWSVITIQYNSTSSQVRVNGLPFPVGSPQLYDLGTLPLKGITVNSIYTLNNTDRMRFGAILWIQGSQSAAQMLQTEENLGCQFGIYVP